MLWPVVKALIGHYRRYPFQVLLVWLGLTLGVSLLVGVLAINHHAYKSYQNGEKLFSNPLPYRIRPKQTINKIPQGFYIELRRAGFNQCAPFDSLPIQTPSGKSLTLIGLDPSALVQLVKGTPVEELDYFKLMQPPYPVLVSEDLAGHFKWKNGDTIKLSDGQRIGPIKVDSKGLLHGTRLVADMSVLRGLERSATISLIACSDMPSSKLANLKANLPSGVELVRSSAVEFETLTRAFHVNLNAMGMLAFLVGLFIFYQAMSLSLNQRQRLVGMLRQTGVSGWQLTRALSLELFVLIFVCWLCGNLFGLFLANQLIPKVSSSLADLYGANVGLHVSWDWKASFDSLVLCVLGAAIACTWPLVRLIRTQPIRLTTRLALIRFTGKEFSLQALVACGLAVAAIAVYQAPHTEGSGYAIITFMFLSTALMTPFIIWKVFDTFSYILPWVKVRWFFADAAASMSYRGVATMAFMLAMAANIGIETMISSFRDTTDKWLNQRLAADVYVYPHNNVASRMSVWLKAQPEVNAVWWRWEKEVQTSKGIIQVVSTGDSDSELDSMTVKLGVPNYWYHLHHSKSVMISESMALKLNIRPGDQLDLSGNLGAGWRVVGVYYDYGNPFNQILLSQRNWLQGYSGGGSVVLGVRLDDKKDIDDFSGRLSRKFKLSSERLFDNSHIYAHALKTFDRTFSIADTLGNITLVIAVLGISFATMAGETSRQQNIALLRCLGISGREILVFAGLQLLVFGIISILIAIPLGLVLANLVVEIIIKNYFGWTMVLNFIPQDYLVSVVLILIALIFAGSLAVVRVVKLAPIKSLRDAV